MIYDFFKLSLNPINFFKCVKYTRDFKKANPDFFDLSGLLVFTGAQGEGKTLSAVLYVCQVMAAYPKCLLVSNIDISHFPIDNKRVFRFINADDLTKYNNGDKGVIFLIDEIQLYFNSLDSKNIDPAVMVQISQQRKQRKHIVATSQVFGRLAKPLREQFSNVVYCKKILGYIQYNRLIDRDSMEGEASTSTDLVGKVKKRFIWFHKPSYYGCYDTYNIINNNFKNIKEQNIYVMEVKSEL